MGAAPAPRILLSGQDGGLTNYIRAVRAAGGTPVSGYCPPVDLTCDGLLLCGGGDLDAALYGQDPWGSQPPDQERDRAELALFHAFFQAGKPILGICRGMQVINAALGGTLIQDLPPELRPFHTWSGRDQIHPVRSEPDSLLHTLCGPHFAVNSSHHQACALPGRGLRFTLWSEGGVPEALEHETRPVWAVQFHPERMSGARRRDDAADGAPIFSWFTARCGSAAPSSPSDQEAYIR